MSTTSNKPAAWFWIVGIVALLWNLGGVMSFVMHITISPETIEAMPQVERELYTNFPAWVTLIFFIAVSGSVLGNILLLMKRKLATMVLIIAFAAILIQMLYTVFMSKAIEVHGAAQALLIPMLVTVIGAVLVWLSRTATAKGWLN